MTAVITEFPLTPMFNRLRAQSAYAAAQDVADATEEMHEAWLCYAASFYANTGSRPSWEHQLAFYAGFVRGAR